MTKADWDKLTIDEKITRIDEKVTRMQYMNYIRTGVIILGFLGIGALIQSRTAPLIKNFKLIK